MGFMDKLRGKLTEAVNQHGDKIDQGIDKAGRYASERTGGKYDEHIDKGSEHLRGGLDKLDGKNDDSAADPPGPQTSPPPPPQATPPADPDRR